MPTAYTKETKPITTFTKGEREIDFLLKEDTFYLLLETGDKIVLSRGYQLPVYTKETKPTTSFTKETKP